MGMGELGHPNTDGTCGGKRANKGVKRGQTHNESRKMQSCKNEVKNFTRKCWDTLKAWVKRQPSN